ncbi:hypothetical protein MASR2M15_05640 [Anaerolineales bacterium]
MPYEVSWYAKPSIALYKLIGDVSLEEVNAAVIALRELHMERHAPNCLIVDTLEATYLPTNLHALVNAFKNEAYQNDLTIIVTHNSAIRLLAQLVGQFLKSNIRFVRSLPDAIYLAHITTAVSRQE